MSSPLARLRRLLPWSNTRRAWLERLSLVGVLAVVAVLVALAGDLALWQQVAAWAVLLLAGAILFRADWLKLFGPILWYDLVRTSRRVRTFLLRTAYLLLLLAVLGILYLNAWPHDASRLLNSQIARLAQEFCYTFLITQFVAMVLLAPAFTAGAVAEEKRKKTIQYLLITDLRNHEIILGKLGSRIAHLGQLLLAGLPVLGALEFLGGVDPHIVLAGFAGTAVTVASAAGVGVLASVVARPSRAALILAYLFILAYVVTCGLCQGLPYWIAQPYYTAAAGPLSLTKLVAVVEAGNPVAAVSDIFGSDPIEPALLRVLGAYALFHGGVALATTLTASLLVRRESLREPRPPGARRAARRPPVGDRPMVWKEVHTERGLTRRWFVMLPIGLLVAATLLPLAWSWYDLWHSVSYRGPEDSWMLLRQYLNGWVRGVGTIAACLTLLGVAVRAAYCIRTERERETLDGLLTSPLSSEDILYGKWLGAILSARWLLLWLALIWGLAVLGGGLHPLAVPLLALTWCVYAAAMASLGLWFSLVSRTSMRGVLYTVFAVLGLSVGHWLLWLPCVCMLRNAPPLEWVWLAQAGATPPVVLGGFLPFGYEERLAPEYLAKFITASLGGDAAWAVLAWMVWQATNQRFKRDGGRVDSGAVRERPAPLRRLS